jgi:transposase-like protein
VTPIPRRRNFSPAYKAALLAELDNCPAGEVGAILRREGVYSSSISTWRQQRRDGQLGTAKRGPKALVPVKPSAANSEAQQLRRENRRLKRELETALLAIDIQKKLAQLMEISRRNDESLAD